MQPTKSILFALVSFACLFSAERLLAQTNRCQICGEPFGDKMYSMTDKVTNEKVFMCSNCLVLPNACFTCGLPVKKDYTELPDGRFLCARDAKTAVLDDTEAKHICSEVKDALDRIFSRFMAFPTNVDVAIVDRVNLLALFKVPGNDFECPNVLGYVQSRTNRGSVRYAISLMSALQPAEFKAVCAHEYAHTWIFENVPAKRRKSLSADATEGFCELVASMLMNSQNEEAELKAIKRNNYTRGQIDLFVEAEAQYGFNDVADWMKYGVDDRLTAGRLDRIRDVEMPRPNAKPSTKIPGYAVIPADAPDTLVLKSIIWDENHPLALINGHSFAINEEGSVQVGKTNVTIRCLDIQRDSVRVRIVNSLAEQELRLKANLR
jgi:DNA-directed RNA polymerase subunit N (RpoN/RPB10)